MTSKKSGVLVGIAAIAVIGVAAVLYFSQWPPSGEDATGAIGAAERYRSEQISSEDVKIEQVDLQAFLQTDEFDHLINDPEARKVLTSDAMREAMGNEALRRALDNEGVRRALDNEAVRQAFDNEAMVRAFDNEAFMAAMSQASVREAISNGALAQAMADR